MDFTEESYRKELLGSFPVSHLKALLRGVVEGYSSAPRACKRALDRADQHDGLGVIRRGKINEALRGVCDRQGLDFQDEPNSANSTYFLSIFSGNFRLSAQRLAWRTHKIPSAEIREIWASNNVDGRNREMFPSERSIHPPGVRYVAFLVHGPRRGRRDQPAFVDIVIPDKKLKRFILVFNLYTMFPDVVDELIKVQEPKRREPKPRIDPKRKSNEQ